MRHVFKAAAATEEMLLTGVMAEDVRRLLISSGLAAPGPDLVDQVVAITAGNPLFIVELARHLTLGGPDRPEVPLPRTLGDLVRYRLDALPESGRRVLGAASILGERFRVGDLARALGLDAALIARQLVRSGPDDLGELGELADQMLAVSASTGRADLEMWGRLWRIDTHWYAGRLPAIASETAGLQRCAERAGGPYARWHLLSTRGMLALARAEFDDGQRIFGEAVELLTRIDHPAVHGASVAFGLLLGHHRGHSVELLDASAWDFGADVRWDLFRDWQGPSYSSTTVSLTRRPRCTAGAATQPTGRSPQEDGSLHSQSRLESPPASPPSTMSRNCANGSSPTEGGLWQQGAAAS
jgi:hypothetical protein